MPAMFDSDHDIWVPGVWGDLVEGDIIRFETFPGAIQYTVEPAYGRNSLRTDGLVCKRIATLRNDVGLFFPRVRPASDRVYILLPIDDSVAASAEERLKELCSV